MSFPFVVKEKISRNLGNRPAKKRLEIISEYLAATVGPAGCIPIGALLNLFMA